MSGRMERCSREPCIKHGCFPKTRSLHSEPSRVPFFLEAQVQFVTTQMTLYLLLTFFDQINDL